MSTNESSMETTGTRLCLSLSLTVCYSAQWGILEQCTLRLRNDTLAVLGVTAVPPRIHPR